MGVPIFCDFQIFIKFKISQILLVIVKSQTINFVEISLKSASGLLREFN